ncbi:glycosyltransferase family 2 protein [Siphonobacter aquaeclarae]|uniref:Glycosyl transferase family 2 n=1 Tax=Siphonobacter aquaeclarae TaxID=563176 RepID=A0A1G9WT31_9BACT|nr:glycosyltransferase [Siphonobacter aquaeclarae]SDM87724.1 Glycosyl transferase family 2 [Siphonobacter aquaeclarae]
MKEAHFPDVTLLVTHYNRSQSLANLLQTFRERGCRFGGIVVSDDGSRPEHRTVLESLRKEYGFDLVTTPKNKGLGNNINKGQDAVRTPYTLYVQEDFVPLERAPEVLEAALSRMQEDSSLDLVRLYAYFPYPYREDAGGGFSRMIFRPQLWYANHLKFYFYSDHPHLRRSTFFDRFGRYVEGTNSDIAEFTMCLSVLKHKGKGLFYDEFTKVFDQVNSSVEPSTATFRSDWKQRQDPLTLLLRWLYLKFRFLKNTFQLLFFR